MITLRQLMNQAKESNESLLKGVVDNIPLFADYNSKIDRLMISYHGTREFDNLDESFPQSLIDFRDVCKAYVDTMLDNYAKIESMLEIDYNPLENYDRNEEFFGSETTTTTPTGTETNSLYDFPSDSDEFMERNRSVSSFNERITDVTTAYGTGDNKRYNHLHGNIGTTKTQEMYVDEMNLRRKNIMLTYLRDIIITCTE